MFDSLNIFGKPMNELDLIQSMHVVFSFFFLLLFSSIFIFFFKLSNKSYNKQIMFNEKDTILDFNKHKIFNIYYSHT